MLATVPIRYVRDWLRNYLDFPDGIIAIGGNDKGDFGWEVWGWEDMRTSWSWENWKKGEPNGMTSENCLAIWPDYYNDDYYHYWYDIPCWQQKPFICQTRNCYGLRGNNQVDYSCRDNVGGCPVWGGQVKVRRGSGSHQGVLQGV